MLVRSSSRAMSLTAALLLIAAMVLGAVSPALAAGETPTELAMVRSSGASLYDATGTALC